jgi:hypothetical protein
VKGRKRYLLVDTLSLPIASRVEPAGMSDRRGGARLVAGLSLLWPTIHTVIADAGHESRKLAAEIKRYEGWKLLIVKRSDRAFKIVGLNWIVGGPLPGSVAAAVLPRITSTASRPPRRSSTSQPCD